MLPGLQTLLQKTPEEERHGWIVNPLPIDCQIRSQAEWFKPTTTDLRGLASEFNNSAIARACEVTETTVRKWLRDASIVREAEFQRHQGDMDRVAVAEVRGRADRLLSHSARRKGPTQQ